MHRLSVVGEQIKAMIERMKDMDLDIINYKRKSEENETKLKDLKQLFESVRSDRNLCSKSLLQANVSDAVLLLKSTKRKR